MIYTHNVSSGELDLAEDFSKRRLESSVSKYSSRGGGNPKKLLNDLTVGVLGEFGAKAYFESLRYTSTAPDLMIYDKKSKNFDADLTVMTNYEYFSVHVKSQSDLSAKRYGQSWLLQKEDPLYRLPGKRDQLLFTNVSNDLTEVKIVAMIPAVDVIYGKPRLLKLRDNKVAIYLEEQKWVCKKSL